MIKRFSFTLLFCQMIGLPYALADTQAEQDQALQNQSVQSQSVQSQESQTEAVQEVEDVIPITMANIEGQKHLYQEGWYIISSSAKAFEYAKKHSVDLSFQAIEKASQRIALRSEQYTSDLNQALDEGQNTHNAVLESGTQRTHSLINKAQKAAQSQRIYSKNKAAEAWQALISGYVYLGKSSQESLNKIKGLPGNYVDKLSQDHQQMWQSVKRFHEKNNPNILAQWDNALEQAETEFEQAYLDSGHKGNSLTGLWRLMTGYVSGAYKGVVKPTLDSSWQVTKY